MESGERIHINSGDLKGSGTRLGHCAPAGFIPAFRHQQSGEIRLSLLENGDAASVHLIGGLPRHWLTDHGRGRPAYRLATGIIAGFVRKGRFYSRKQALASL